MAKRRPPSTAAQTFCKLDAMLIGAEKSGTSYIYTAIREHESVYVGDKDRDIFRLLKSGSSQYDELFMADYCGQSIVMAFDAAFMLNQDSALLLKERTGDSVKAIVALLRDPIDRAISEYRMRLRQGFEFRPFDKAVTCSELRKRVFPGHWEQRWAYLERGLYWSQLEPYLSNFGTDRLIVRLFEDSVAETPQELLQSLFSKLDLNRPSNTSYEAILEKGGRESPEPVQLMESQRRAGVTEDNLAEWLAYVPSGKLLGMMKDFFATDVQRIGDVFNLPVGKYWRNFA